MEIHKTLKEARLNMNMSIYRLSQITGISQTHLRDIERGDRNPSLDTLMRISTPLGLNPGDLFGSSTIDDLTQDEKELLYYYRSLPVDKAKALLYFLKS